MVNGHIFWLISEPFHLDLQCLLRSSKVCIVERVNQVPKRKYIYLYLVRNACFYEICTNVCFSAFFFVYDLFLYHQYFDK